MCTENEILASMYDDERDSLLVNLPKTCYKVGMEFKRDLPKHDSHIFSKLLVVYAIFKICNAFSAVFWIRVTF